MDLLTVLGLCRYKWSSSEALEPDNGKRTRTLMWPCATDVPLAEVDSSYVS
jgi:hypothetical protein